MMAGRVDPLELKTIHKMIKMYEKHDFWGK